MTSIEDILFDGLIQTNNTTYDIELYFNTILEKFIKFIRLLQYSPLDKIKEYIQLYNNIITFHNFYFRNRIYPINYLFMNNNLSVEMIDYILTCKFKLSYNNEYNLITYYLLNNKLDEEKKIDIFKYLNLNKYDFSDLDYSNNNIFHYLANYNNSNNKLYELIFSYCNDINKQNKQDITPLLLATTNNNINYINFLLSKNCNTNLVNTNHNSSLMYACMNNSYEIHRLFLWIEYAPPSPKTTGSPRTSRA